MAHIFISHSSKNNIEAYMLKEWLKTCGWDDIFLDLDLEKGINTSENWKDTLNRELKHCKVVLCLISPEWLASTECTAEYRTAQNHEKTIFPVIISPCEKNDFTNDIQECKLYGNGEHEDFEIKIEGNIFGKRFLSAGLHKLKYDLKHTGIEASYYYFDPEKQKPYKGLSSLDFDDAAVFFGRDAPLERAINCLHDLRHSNTSQLFTILGASGSGKSSFMKAGLLPRLTRDDLNFFPISVIRPENAAISGENGLVRALEKTFRQLNKPISFADIRKRVINDNDANGFLFLLEEIIQLVSQKISTYKEKFFPSIIIPIDQLEELFNAEGAKESKELIRLLSQLLMDKQIQNELSTLTANIIVICTIRSDRYEKLQNLENFLSIENKLFDLKAIPPSEFRAIIEGPANLMTKLGYKLSIDHALTEQLLFDLANNIKGSDPLPLLAFTLERLYSEYGGDGDLRLNEYQGIHKVIDEAIESALKFPEKDPAIPIDRSKQLQYIRRIFIPNLIRIEEYDETLIPVRQFALIDKFPPETNGLLRRLVDKARLLIEDHINGKHRIEIGHESILHKWEPLSSWLEEETRDIRTRDNVYVAAKKWRANNYKESYLIHKDELLIAAERVLKREDFSKEFSEIDIDYLKACRNNEEIQNQNELELERHRSEVAIAQKHEAEIKMQAFRREKKQFQVFASIAIFIAITAIIAFLWAIKEQKETELRELVAQAESSLSFDRQQGLMMAISAVLQISTDLPDKYSYGLFPGWIYNESIKKDALTVLHRATQLSRTKYVIDPNIQGLWCVAISSDGKKMAAGGVKGTVIVWDTTSWKEITRLVHPSEVRGVVFSPDNNFIATASYDNAARIWDIKTGKEKPFIGHKKRVRSVSFSPDGRVLASGSEDGKVILWDTYLGNEIKRLNHNSPIWSVIFDPADSDFLASGGDDGILMIWNINSSAPIHKLPGHFDKISSIAYSPDGKFIASSSADRTVRIWKRNGEGYSSFPLTGHNSNVWNLAFNSDGTLLATTGGDGSKIWKLVNENIFLPQSNLIGHSGRGIGVAFGKNNENPPILATVGDDGTLRVWDTSERFELPSLVGHSGWIRGVDYISNSEDKIIITASEDKTIRFFDSVKGSEKKEPFTHTSKILALALNKEGSKLAISSIDGFVTILDLSGEKPLILQRITGNQERNLGIALSASGDKIVTSNSDNTAKLWDSLSGKELLIFNGHEGFVYDFSFSSDGNLLASASDDMSIKIWDVETGNIKYRECCKGHTAPVRGVLFNPNPIESGVLASIGADGLVILWDIENGDYIFKNKAHSGEIRALSFNKDGNLLASAGDDGKIKIWNAISKSEVLTLDYPGIPFDISFSPDGTQIAAAGTNDSVLIFTLDIRELIELGLSRLQNTNAPSLKLCDKYLPISLCSSITGSTIR